MLTPFLSAWVMKTKNVDTTTDINGALAASQKILLFLIAYNCNMLEAIVRHEAGSISNG
jgi:hypothetical protein